MQHGSLRAKVSNISVHKQQFGQDQWEGRRGRGRQCITLVIIYVIRCLDGQNMRDKGNCLRPAHARLPIWVICMRVEGRLQGVALRMEHMMR